MCFIKVCSKSKVLAKSNYQG